MVIIRYGKNEHVTGVRLTDQDQVWVDNYNKSQTPTAKYWSHAETIEFDDDIDIYSRPEVEEWLPKIKPPNIKPIEVYNVNVIQEWGEWKYGMTSNQWHAKYWSPHNGFCGEFMDPEPFVEFTYKEAPVTMIDCYMNEFFKDHPELNGVIRLYFDS